MIRAAGQRTGGADGIGDDAGIASAKTSVSARTFATFASRQAMQRLSVSCD
jgi:hypothetical protein